MNALKLLRLKQLKFEVASQIVLRKWKPEDLSKPKCPKCSAIGFPTPYQKQGDRFCYGMLCNHHFRLVSPDRSCHCVLPGQEETCLGCPNFEHFISLVQEQLPDLEHLSLEELLFLKMH